LDSSPPAARQWPLLWGIEIDDGDGSDGAVRSSLMEWRWAGLGWAGLGHNSATEPTELMSPYSPCFYTFFVFHFFTKNINCPHQNFAKKKTYRSHQMRWKDMNIGPLLLSNLKTARWQDPSLHANGLKNLRNYSC